MPAVDSPACLGAWAPNVGSLTLCAGLLLKSNPVAAFDLQGHRGARGLAPENTLAGLRTALAVGVTTLETDLALTRDGVLVLSHEPRLTAVLTRGPDGRWLSEDGTPSQHSTLPNSIATTSAD